MVESSDIPFSLHKVNPESSPAVLQNIPRIDISEMVNEIIDQSVAVEKIGSGYQGMVIRAGPWAIKIGYGYDLPEQTANDIAKLTFPNDRGVHDTVATKLTRTLIHHASFEQQAAAHVVGHAVTPDIVDEPIAIITHKGKSCGIITPYYEGEHLSLSDPRLNQYEENFGQLSKAGVELDSFSRRKNGILTSEGLKIIDLSTRRDLDSLTV